MADTDETLSPSNAAKLLGLAPSSLAKMRCWGRRSALSKVRAGNPLCPERLHGVARRPARAQHVGSLFTAAPADDLALSPKPTRKKSPRERKGVSGATKVLT